MLLTNHAPSLILKDTVFVGRLLTQTVVAVLLATALMACSDDVVAPEEFRSKDLVYEVGDTVVYRIGDWSEGTALNLTFDTSVVTERTVVNGNVHIAWEGTSQIWRVVNGAFEIVWDSDVIILGKVPAPTGRWPDYVDTTELTNDNGELLRLAFQVFVTISPDTTISTPAGSFRCSAVESFWEDKNGNVVEEFLVSRYFYGPGYGLVLATTLGETMVGGQIKPLEQRFELYRIPH